MSQGSELLKLLTIKELIIEVNEIQKKNRNAALEAN